ncbi:inhibitor of trypsin and hageman factor-like [Andrographis paniculata]|uniref:inhibitor of trypsin and hageman factor-like n=1 Tax=Andrographis paniculata TaxID=175694 RepID=UPI0021E7D869|nr:inhibitor of trypsin and hageman factor-like [Andrographis paniculata]
MSNCPGETGKKSWPELVGVDGEAAAAVIKAQNPKLNVIVLKEGTPVTRDLRCDRVRVWVDGAGDVASPPQLG